MKWLSKVGQLALQVGQLLSGIGPIVKYAIPGTKDDQIIDVISKDLAEIETVIVNAEIMGQALQLPGAQKLEAAAPLVAQVILHSAIMANYQIGDADLFQSGVKKIADGMADVLNSRHAKVDSVNKVS